MTTAAAQLVAAGQPREALALLQQQVCDRPDEPKSRVFLFQLLCVLGEWPRALTQLQVCGELDAGALAMVNIYRDALQCEAVREAVFGALQVAEASLVLLRAELRLPRSCAHHRRLFQRADPARPDRPVGKLWHLCGAAGGAHQGVGGKRASPLSPHHCQDGHPPKIRSQLVPRAPSL